MLNNIKEFLKQEIFPHLYACYVEKFLEKKLQELQDKNFRITLGNKKDSNELIKELIEYQEKEKRRKRIIEDKAKSSLFIIALTITLILGSLNFLKDSAGGVISKFPILLILIIGVIFLLFSGITSIKALNIRKFYDVYLNDRVDEDKGKLSIKKYDETCRILEYYKNVQSNQKITIIRSNFVYATFVGIRNGIILIALFFIITVGSMYWGNLSQYYNEKTENKPVEKSVVNGNIEQNEGLIEPVDRIKEVAPDFEKREKIKDEKGVDIEKENANGR